MGASRRPLGQKGGSVGRIGTVKSAWRLQPRRDGGPNDRPCNARFSFLIRQESSASLRASPGTRSGEGCPCRCKVVSRGCCKSPKRIPGARCSKLKALGATTTLTEPRLSRGTQVNEFRWILKHLSLRVPGKAPAGRMPVRNRWQKSPPRSPTPKPGSDYCSFLPPVPSLCR